MDTREWVNMWHAPFLDGLELHHATYITHTFARHMHDYYVIGVIEDGIQTFECKGSRYVTPTYGVFIINPGEVHTGEAATERGFTYRTLYPDLALMQRATSDIAGREQSLPFFVQPVIHDRHLARLLCEVHVALASSFTPLECQSRFLHALSYLVEHYAKLCPPQQAPGQERRAIREVRHYIDAHFMERVSLADLAQLVNLSPYYLLRTFEKEVGISPHAYLESVRIREAQRLLKQGWPLVQVAYELGFSHQSHLTHRFKRLLGITPGQYLKQSKIVQDKARS